MHEKQLRMKDEHKDYLALTITAIVFILLALAGCTKDPVRATEKINCGVDDMLGQFYVEPPKNYGRSNINRIVRVKIYCDNSTLSEYVNLYEAENAIREGFDRVEQQFDQENIHIYLSDVKFVTWADTINTARDILYAFPRHELEDSTIDLHHFITSRDLGGTVGIAWIGLLCRERIRIGGEANTWAGPWAVSTRMNWESMVFIKTFSHEMGHNLGSRHTHDCVWGPNDLALDECAENNCDEIQPVQRGTIMSYCWDIDLEAGFGTLPGNLIRSAVLNASCLPIYETFITGAQNGLITGHKIVTEGISSANLTIEATEVDIGPNSEFDQLEIIIK